MPKEIDIDHAIERVLERADLDFVGLTRLASLNPSKDFRYSDLRNVDFSGQDLSGFDFTGSDITGCKFDGARINRAKFRKNLGSRSVLRTAKDWNPSAPPLAIFEEAAIGAGHFLLSSIERRRNESSSKRPPVGIEANTEGLLRKIIGEALPKLPIIMGERDRVAFRKLKVAETFILCRPLTGTRELLRGGQEFSIDIALIKSGAPTVGIVYLPALKIAYIGSGDGAEKLLLDDHAQIQERWPIFVRERTNPPIGFTAGRTTVEERQYLKGQNAVIQEVSRSLRFCLIAEGLGDIAPGFEPTMPWNIAAGDAVLRAAGGQTVSHVHNDLLQYHLDGFDNPNSFQISKYIARGQLSLYGAKKAGWWQRRGFF